MPLGLQLRQLYRDLKSQKLRVFLTTFGIVWGTVAISLLLGFGEGLEKQLYINNAGLGEYIVIAWPALTSMPFEGLGKGRPIRLTEEDIELLRQEVPGLLGISPEFPGSLKLNYGTRALSVEVHGVEPEYGDLRNMIPQSGGRWLNPIDEREKRRVAFIGDELATDVFGDADPVGQSVRIAGSPFLIVGVLKPKTQDSSYSGRDNEKVMIPASTKRALTGVKYAENFVFKAKTSALVEPVKAKVLEVLARKHRFDPRDDEALMMWDTTEQYQFFDAFMLAFRSFLGIVGSLTLVVGGIGVSNIMSVVVEERSREIGIKMALGARSGQILFQFMMETFLITAVGGAVGLLIAAGICSVVPSLGMGEYIGVPRVSTQVGGLTASLLGVVALLAGFFPARSAAGLDPVTAMKK